MKLWKKIGNTELDLFTVFTITEMQPLKDPVWYHVKLINGESLRWTPEEKKLFDEEMFIHDEAMKVMGAISSMQSSYIGKPIGG